MRTATDAAAYARARAASGEVMPDSGLCLQMTRQNYPVSSYYYSAIDAWNGAQWRHLPGEADIPVGCPAWFDSASIYGHVAIHVAAGLFAVTTFNADIRELDLDAMQDVYGPYMGWAEDLNGVRVWTPDTPTTTGDDDMRMVQRNNANGTVALLDGGGTYLLLGKYAVQHWTDALGAPPRVVAAESYDGTLACLTERHL